MARAQDFQPILPDPGKKNVLVTSALPYVNNVPHLGNIIGSCLSADVFARYCRGRGIRTLFIGGTDEYGTTTEVRAMEDGITPQELCDKYHKVHADVYKWFDISFDIFGRTTTDLHTKITQQMFLQLKHNGFLDERTTTQLYCEQHHAFLADRFVEGECPVCKYPDARGDQCDSCGRILDSTDLIHPRCKVDRSTPVTKDTKHVFLKLDELQPTIADWFQKAAQRGGWTNNGKAITMAWLKESLQARSITRDMKWGTAVPLPGYEDKVIYSWFDACIGYVSITAEYTGTEDWKKWWCNPADVQLSQFIGKDNMVYHSVIFPGSQIGTNEEWTKVHHLSTTEYLTYEGGKFSKSRGIGVFGDSAQKTGVPSDVWRYYLLAHRPETRDTEFTWDAFISSNNNVLLNNLGNFVSRVLKFVKARYNGTVPDYGDYHDQSFDIWKADINDMLKLYIQDLDAVKLRAGLVTVLQISQHGNLFLQLNKLDGRLQEQEPFKCAAVISLALNLVHLLASVVAPYMPETADSINKQLCLKSLQIPDHWTADSVKSGHHIGDVVHLFARIIPEKAQEWRVLFGSPDTGSTSTAGGAQTSVTKITAKLAKAKLSKSLPVPSKQDGPGPANGNA